MPHPYRGKPRSTSRVVLPDGRTAVLVPRDRRHFSQLRNGYPLAEEFLDGLAPDVDAVAVDDGERIHAFDLRQYRTGNRVGHAPYPMKRVVDVDAADAFEGAERDALRRAAEWEWLTEDDLRPARDRRTDSSRPEERRDGSLTAD